jgi:hypothetical protein
MNWCVYVCVCADNVDKVEKDSHEGEPAWEKRESPPVSLAWQGILGIGIGNCTTRSHRSRGELSSLDPSSY